MHSWQEMFFYFKIWENTAEILSVVFRHLVNVLLRKRHKSFWKTFRVKQQSYGLNIDAHTIGGLYKYAVFMLQI